MCILCVNYRILFLLMFCCVKNYCDETGNNLLPNINFGDKTSKENVFPERKFTNHDPIIMNTSPQATDYSDRKLIFNSVERYEGKKKFTQNDDRISEGESEKLTPSTHQSRKLISSHSKVSDRLIISDRRDLSSWPDLPETNYNLQYISLDRTRIRMIPSTVCSKFPNIRSLTVKSSLVQEIPRLSNCTKLELLDFGYNEIARLEEGTFSTQSRLTHLILNHNLIKEIHDKSFHGLNNLEILDLSHNQIKYIHSESFASLTKLVDLDLGGNSFPVIPSKGLSNLRHIKAYGNVHLTQFPEPDKFPNIQTLALSYAYHCCQYLSASSIDSGADINGIGSIGRVNEKLKEEIIWLHKDEVNMIIWNSTWSDNESIQRRKNFPQELNRILPTVQSDLLSSSSSPNFSQYSDEYGEDYKTEANTETLLIKHPIECLPQPSPFMPCEDLFDWWTLRCGAWIVFLMALLGNGVVIIVLLFGRSKLDVPKFLVCNLAMADFLMGIYLGTLAIVDAITLGEFKVHAISWQRSFTCQITGFFGVLSTELSVYTLAVITSERNYAITHAMHMNKRLSLKHASYIMTLGWIFAILMAILPLIGISDYRKFAICLPFEISDSWSMAYVISLIAINGAAFFILMGCYLRMYCAIRGSQAWNSNDSRIAKRMALLVFTDFLCWAPIAFFTLTAVFGYELINLNEAKVFTVFVLPLNACANPFLYAIFTKQFKKECVLLCKRIEESRVTRGIGRGHNSSNFSNRLTPMNTNSATDKRNSGELTSPAMCKCEAQSDYMLNLDNPFDLVSKSNHTSNHPTRHHNSSSNHHSSSHHHNSSDHNCENDRPVSSQSKSSVIKQMTAKWLSNHKQDSFRMDSTDSTSYPSSNQPGSRRRLDSSSSGNFSLRSNSRKTSVSSAKLLEMKRAIPVAVRRSSWTGSTSTSTYRASTTRSSVSSDSSSAMFRYDLKVGSHVFREDEPTAIRPLLRRSISLRRKGFLCKDCAETRRKLPSD